MITCDKGWLVLVCMLAGCIHVTEHNAPGVVELERAPRDLKETRTEVPGDPGQEVLRGTLGGSVLLGALWGQPGGGATDLVSQPTLELSLTRYELPRSYTGRYGMFEVAIPEVSSRQLNLGWTPVEFSGRTHRLGPVYVEGQYNWMPLKGDRLPLSIAGGWALVPGSWEHGPQATFSFLMGSMSARVAYLFGRGWYGGVMVTMKLPAFVRIWSK